MSETWAELLQRPEIQVDRRILASAVIGRRVLITGAGGSVGSALVRLVRDLDPAALALLDHHEASLVRLAQQLGQPASFEVRYQLVDLRDQRKLSQVFQRFRPEVVFHLAAYKHVSLAEDNVDQVIGVNLIGTVNLIEAAIAAGTSQVIYPSSDKAVTPHRIYAASKRIVERLLQAFAEADAPVAPRVVRLVNVFGTQGSVVEIFLRQIQENRPLSITDVRMDRYWMTMREATHLLLAAATRPRFEGFYMLDVGQPVLLVDTLRRLYAMVRPGGEPAIAEIGIRPGERLHEELLYPTESIHPSEIPGFLIIRVPPASIGAETWVAELRCLERECQDGDLDGLRDRLLALATDTAIASPDEARRRARLRDSSR